MAGGGIRLGARCIDAAAQLVLVVITWVLFGDQYRIWTDLFLAFMVIWAYEALFTRWLGGTPGMRLVGVRVVELDGLGKPSTTAALRRGAATSVLTNVPLVGWGIMIAGVFGDALGRGFPDRAASTMVVPDRFVGPVATRDLPGFADGVRPPRVTPLGRVADLDVRARARLRRIVDTPILAAAIGLLALAVSLPFATGWLVLASSAAWVVVFVAHETWCVHRTAQTPGHELASLLIIDRRSGAAPSSWRSFFRALVLGLTLYVPLLWPLLFVSLLMMGLGSAGRGLHDFAGGTVVIIDPRLDPETQRQRSMRMRLGRAG